MRGSKRCIIELVSSADFLTEINFLIQETGAVITNRDTWIPIGLVDPREAQLKNFLRDNFGPQYYDEIVRWWMHVDTTTPHWDFVSTCTIDGKRGLLLVEAKAHCDELNEESHGKNLNREATDNSIRNHIKIGEAIIEAKEAIKISFPEVSISRDNCYQLSNRVAHAWWLASHDIPVVLMYLGFLNVHDMKYGGRLIFRTHEEWKTCFMNHSRQVGVDGIVDEWVDCEQSRFKLIVRSI